MSIKGLARMRRWLWALGILATAILIATIYVRQPAPRSALGDAVGVRRSRPFNRFCGWFVRDTRVGTWPTGEADCAWYRPETPLRRAELDELSYHVLTRRVYSAARSWEPLSDDAWRRDLDSVRTALQNQGGVPTARPWARHTPDGVQECWRFPDFDIELSSGSATMPAGFPGAGERRWSLFLRGGPAPHAQMRSVPACAARRRRR